MPRAFNPPGVWQPFGAFSLVTLQGDGQVTHLKGQVPLDAERNIVGIGDMPAQVDKVLENIQAVLAALGGEMGDILSLTQHTTDIAAFMTSGDVRARYFKEPYPATTTVEVSALYHPDIMVEITAIAEIPRGRFVHPG
ncbi:MAG: enamine deaminase RidA [Rhodospirillaceae bacterium]|nr:enamine deaminase RidA [Rhodospirillaceae bacterium]